MHFKKLSVAAAAAIGMMGTAHAAVIKGMSASAHAAPLTDSTDVQPERDDGEAFVVMHQVVSQSPSIVYATSTQTVTDCGTRTDCPLSTSTVVVLTTYCPQTATEITTVGTPTGTGPLSTITTVVTITGTSKSNSASLVPTPSVSGPGGSPPSEASSAPASTGASSSGSTIGVPGATSVSPESTGPQSESHTMTTILSTSTLLSTVTVPASEGTETQTLTSVPSPSASTSNSAIGVPGVSLHSLDPQELAANFTQSGSETTTTSFSLVPSMSEASSFSTNTIGPIGGTASSSFLTPTTNGTLNTPTPTAPTQSIVPYTGGAADVKYESVIGTAIVLAAAAFFI